MPEVGTQQPPGINPINLPPGSHHTIPKGEIKGEIKGQSNTKPETDVTAVIVVTLAAVSESPLALKSVNRILATVALRAPPLNTQKASM